MAAPDGRDPYGLGDDAEWAMSADPADDWILDPDTGEYRMRLPGERLPAPMPAATRSAGIPASSGAGLELRSTREIEIVHPPAPRTGGRAAERGSRRGGRRRGSDNNAGGLWLVVVLGLIGVAGCGFGGYLLLEGGSARHTCAAAPSPAPAPVVKPSPSDGGPAIKPGPHAAPINVRVSIYDGTGNFAAGAVLNWMQIKQGYLRTSNKGPVKPRETTSLVYEPLKADQARTLAAAMHLPPQDLHGTAKGDGYLDAMTLTLGKDFVAPGEPLRPPPTPTRAAAPTECSAS